MSESGGTVHVGAIVKNSLDEVRVSLSEYMGKPLVDVRVYRKFQPGSEASATKRGVTFQPSQLPELIKLLIAAEVQARVSGQLGDGPKAGGA